jgi:transcriptional regulator with XRE-family HTH domain
MKNIDNSVCLEDFGRWVKAARERRKLSQAEVAQVANINQSQYCRIESAKREVDLITAMRICGVLGLDLSDFIKSHM